MPQTMLVVKQIHLNLISFNTHPRILKLNIRIHGCQEFDIRYITTFWTTKIILFLSSTLVASLISMSISTDLIGRKLKA